MAGAAQPRLTTSAAAQLPRGPCGTTHVRWQEARPAGSIVWFRQDLRLADNPALLRPPRPGRCCPSTSWTTRRPARGRWAARIAGGCITAWNRSASLAEAGRPWCCAAARPPTIIAELAASTGAAAVHAGQMVEPWARAQDAGGAGGAAGGRRAAPAPRRDAVRPGAVRPRPAASTASTPRSPAPPARWVRRPAPHRPRPPDGWPRRVRRPGGLASAADQAGLGRRVPRHLAARRGRRPGPRQAFMAERCRLPRRPQHARARTSPPCSRRICTGASCRRRSSGTPPRAGSGEGLERLPVRAAVARVLRQPAVAPPAMPEQPQRADFARLRWREDPAGCAPGSAAAPACRSWTPGCASSGTSAGCTTGSG